MAAPQILDREGNRLAPGDSVKRRILSGHWNQDVFRRVGWEPMRGWVAVTRAMPRLPLQPDAARNTYRVPDLIRINKGEGDD
jgi:hypothetical protein